MPGLPPFPVTVPGADGTVITYIYTGANSLSANQISVALAGYAANGLLAVEIVAGGGTVPPASSNVVNALELTSSGTFQVPSNYGYVLDGSTDGTLSVSGGTNFLGGNGAISYTNSGVGTSLIVTGNGPDTFNLSGGYLVAAGSGSNQFNLDGVGQVSLGGGSNFVRIEGGADTISAANIAGGTGIIGGEGSVFFQGGDNPSQVNNVIVGGTQGTTIVGGQNSVNIYGSPTTGGAHNPGAVLLAGDGNQTLFGAPSQTNDALWGSFGNSYSDLLVAGSGNAALIAGNCVQSLIGGSGTDTFYVISSEVVSALTHTSVSPGIDILYTTRAGETLALLGFDSLYGAAGSGAAAAFVESSLAAGSRAVSLFVAPDANSVTLKDGTTIVFATGTNGVNFASS